MEGNETYAIDAIRRRGGKFDGKIILLKSAGIRLLKYVDYLCHYKGYRWQKVW